MEIVADQRPTPFFTGSFSGVRPSRQALKASRVPNEEISKHGHHLLEIRSFASKSHT
jgi:hypothetical protein